MIKTIQTDDKSPNAANHRIAKHLTRTVFISAGKIYDFFLANPGMTFCLGGMIGGTLGFFAGLQIGAIIGHLSSKVSF